MGRAKTIDEPDLQELLSLRDDMGLVQKDQSQMQADMAKLHDEVHSISSKQGDISVQMGNVEQVVMDLGKQLSTINSVLQVLVKAPTNGSTTEVPSSSQQRPNSPTTSQEQMQTQLLRTEQLRKQLEAEKEKTRQLEELQQQNLPPIRTSRPAAPPGFAQQGRPEHLSPLGTPVTARQSTHTPIFKQYYQQNRDRQLWQGYAKTYEQDMQCQFMKSLTKGPKMDFPRFEGEDPVGWIRQCNKYFQMSGAPEEYKVSLDQLYIIGEADVWLRRSGLLKKKVSWKEFCTEITK